MSRGLSAEQLSVREQQWTGLSILNKFQKGDAGMVEFKAGYIDSNNVHHWLHEKSVFTRQGGRWLYVGGEVS